MNFKMNNSESLISVIVPVYNSEKYLRQCIDSILAQSFSNFELIIIDDGSLDCSGGICDDYVKKDERVKVIHKENGGVSSARNSGINAAVGEWICFVDSDDYVSPDYISNLYQGIKKTNRNGLVWSSYDINGVNRIALPNKVFYGGDAAKFILLNNILSLSGPVAKLFSRDIIINNTVKFPDDIQMGEDGIFIQQYLYHVEYVSFINKVDYFVRKTEGSLSTRYYSFENEWRCFELWERSLRDYINKYPDFFEDPQRIIWNNRIGQTFFRCAISVAHQTPQWSFIKQYMTIREKLPAYLEAFSYYKPQERNMKILKEVIIHRQYLLFICLLYLSKIKGFVK